MVKQTTSPTPKRRSVSIEEAFVIARQNHVRGKEVEAQSIYREILKKSPEHAESMHYLGLIEYRQGHTEEALKLLRGAVQLSPKTAVFHSNLGVMFKKEGLLYEAEAAHRKALSLKPDRAESYYDLGLVQQLQESYEEAEQSYRQAIALKPDYPNALNNLGSVLKELEEMEPAADVFRSAIALTPEDPDLHYNLGCVLTSKKDLSEAEMAYQRCLEFRPDYAPAYRSLGKVFLMNEKPLEAEAALWKAIELQKDDYEAYYYLADVREFTLGDALLAKFKNFLNHTGLSDIQRFMIFGALAKAYEQLGMPEVAFEYYRQSNDEVWRNMDFSAEEQIEDHQAIKRAFPSKLKLPAQPLNDNWTPIFVIGMSRSGKSLTEKILAGHQDVYAGEENKYFSMALKKVLKRYGILKDYPDCMPLLNEERVIEVGKGYRELMENQSQEKPFVVNTIPGNYRLIGLILQALPTARIIDCHRDPLDNCLKVYFKRYQTGNSYSYDLKSLGLYYRLYYDLVAYWRHLYPERMLSIQYEELLNTPLTVAEKMFRHCGIRFDSDSIETDELNKDEIGCAMPYKSQLVLLNESLMQTLESWPNKD